jgi:hypothetical protein
MMTSNLPSPPSEDKTRGESAEPIEEEAFPSWAAALVGSILGAASVYLRFQEIHKRMPDGGGRAVGELFGGMIFAPAVALVISVAIRPLRTFRNFCIVFSVLSAIGIFGMLRS